MKSKLFLWFLILSALITPQMRADDTTPKPLQGWLDFLGNEEGLPSVVARIGVADWERDVPRVAAGGQLYVWENRYSINAGKTGSLRLLVVPDEDQAGSHPIVVGILDPRTGRGIFLPWARRYMNNVPEGNHMPRWMVAELAGAVDSDRAQAAASPARPLP